MKKTFIGMTLLILVIAACAPQQPTEAPSVIMERTPRPTSTEGLSPAQRAALSLLSETLSLPADQITLISTEAVTWPDGCLGIQRAGLMCTQALVEGYRIVLEAEGKQYELRTNQTGSQVVIASGLEPSDLIERVMIQQLASNLGISESDISLVSRTEVEFNDTCLGVTLENVLCAQMITPGYVIILEAKGIQYEYHISTDGSRVQPATFAFLWKREGGIAGFCDSMTVFLSGEVYGTNCKSTETKMGRVIDLLTADDIAQLHEWIVQYGQVNIDASDPQGVSDRMFITMTFFGRGTQQTLTAPDRERLLEFAQRLHLELYK